jgi:hypothetical protein
MKHLRKALLLVGGMSIALPCFAQWSGDRGSGWPERSPRSGAQKGSGVQKGGGGGAERPDGWDMGNAKSDGGGPAPQQEGSRRGSSAPASQSKDNSRSGAKAGPAPGTGSAKSPPSSSQSSGRPERKLWDLDTQKGM